MNVYKVISQSEKKNERTLCVVEASNNGTALSRAIKLLGHTQGRLTVEIEIAGSGINLRDYLAANPNWDK